MTKFHLFSQDSVRLETAPTGGVRKSYLKYVTRGLHALYCSQLIFVNFV